MGILPGADSGFQVRGGALKKNCAERREARKYLGYFLWKITILRQKIIFFSILGGARRVRRLPWIRPWLRNNQISNDNGILTFFVDAFFPLSLTLLLPDLTIYMSNTTGVLKVAGTSYSSCSPVFIPGGVCSCF